MTRRESARMRGAGSAQPVDLHNHVRQKQRLDELQDEEEHAKLMEENLQALLADKLDGLRQTVVRIEQDNWKFNNPKPEPTNPSVSRMD